MSMEEILKTVQTPLFAGIAPQDRMTMLGCIGYHITAYSKGDIIALENEKIHYVGIVLSGVVDMVKEDLWGNKTLLVRARQNDLFGETFACGSDNLSVVTFVAAEAARVLFIPFCKAMHNCANGCDFHHKLTENMVRSIADKNRDLMRKLEIVSKRTTREKLLTYLSLQAQLQNTRYFEIPLGRIELAEYLCVDRSAMTRELVKMKDEGLIDFDRNCFKML